MKTVAVTGGIGSGKSTVCGILARRGIPVYDTDSSAKRLYAKDDSLLDSIEESFGCSIRLGNGGLDKEKLAAIAFSSPEKLKTLEGIVHPAVLEDFLRWNAMQSDRFGGSGASEVFFGKAPFCIIESAVILEKPLFLRVADKVVIVDAPLSERLRRACQRDGVSPEKVIQRMAVQHFDLSKVNAVIRNEGSRSQLEEEVGKVFLALNI